MFTPLMILFREGFESFLTVAIILTYLRKTGRDWLRPTVYWAVAFAIAASVGLAIGRTAVRRSDERGIVGSPLRSRTGEVETRGHCRRDECNQPEPQLSFPASAN